MQNALSEIRSSDVCPLGPMSWERRERLVRARIRHWCTDSEPDDRPRVYVLLEDLDRAHRILLD